MKAGLRKFAGSGGGSSTLGRKTEIASRQEAAGFVPKPDDAPKDMQAAEVAIGQEIEVTPLQMAGMIAAVANGGTLFWPRLVSEIRSPDTGETERSFPPKRIRDHVVLRPEDLALVRHAMLSDVETPGVPSNAYNAFHPARHGLLEEENFKVAGKTGTAQVKSTKLEYNHVTWFDSYGPYDSPRYAVVVMVVDGSSGGGTCAPVAAEIREANLPNWVEGGAGDKGVELDSIMTSAILNPRKTGDERRMVLPTLALGVVGRCCSFPARHWWRLRRGFPSSKQTLFLADYLV